MTSHIGIVGVSPEGAALFYQQLTRHAGRLMSPTEQPRISVHNEPLHFYLDAIRRNDWHAVDRLLRRSADLLARCGAQFCIAPDNAVQHAVQMAEVNSPIPWLTMPDLVAAAVAADGRRCVGLIGTKLITTASTYQTHLGLKGVQVLPPKNGDDDLLDEVIFGELIYGQIRPESRLAVLKIIASLADRGCEAVILACSEAPLMVTRDNSPLPVYDAADILAEASIRRSMTRRAEDHRPGALAS
ncbi:MAG: amino acid racemase [Planctomycetota bacterium]|nr:amino acid racemase [Planctomycetota bacterium]